MKGLIYSLSALSLTATIIMIIIAAVAAIGAIVCGVLIYGTRSRKPKKQSGGIYKAPARVKKSVEEKSSPVQTSHSEPVEEVEPKPAPVPVREQKAVNTPSAAQPATERPAPAEETNSAAKPAVQPVTAVKTQRVVEQNGKVFLRIRYNRSFTAKLIQSPEVLKDYYSSVKNEILSYEGVKARISWKYETFRKGRKLLVKLGVRGKTLCAYFALNAADYQGTKYKVEDVSRVSSNAGVPALYRIKNDRRSRYAKQLIANVMEQNGLEYSAAQTEDYKAQYPYEELERLIAKKLVKLLKWTERSDGAEEGIIEMPANELAPEELLREVSAAQAEEVTFSENILSYQAVSEKFSDKSKKAIVNIDTLGKYFNENEKVTLEEMKKRIPEISKKTTYIKVLARGTLSKSLTVEADDYSPAAAKMIILTGGMAIRKR